MLETAVDVVAQVQQEGVVRKGGGAGEELELGGADGLGVGQQALAVELGIVAAEDDAVRNALGGEFENFKGAGFQRAVDKVAVVVCPVEVLIQFGQGGGGLPLDGETEFDLVRLFAV